MSVCKKNLAVYVFVADLQASVYVRDISSVKCIRDTCVWDMHVYVYEMYLSVCLRYVCRPVMSEIST